MSGLPRHRETRDSGIAWLGPIPRHWEVQPARAAFRPKLVKNTGLVEEQVLSLSYGRILVKPTEKLRGLVPESFETYQVVDPGDIIVRTTDLQNDQTSLRIGHSRHRGIITSAYLNLTTTPRVSREFGYQVLNAYDLLKVIYGYGSGLRQNLDFSHIKHMPVPVPPLDEQRAIARYLDHADRRIRRYIRAKQKLIRLLEEQKQAIIHRAVTRGLNAGVCVKPSGVDWLGGIPEHWDVLPLRRRWSVTDCKHLTVPFVLEGVPLASVREVQPFELRLEQARRTTEEWYRVLIEGGRAPRRGDIIYCRNVSVGSAALVETDEPLAMGQDVCLIRSSDQNQRFLNYFLRSPGMATQLSALMVGSTFDRINVAEVNALLVVVPPRSEQDAIAAFLDEVLRSVDRAIERSRDEIALLREYRTRLIADVVTGKLDVREAAAGLDEVGEEAEEGEAGTGVGVEGGGEDEGEGVEGEYGEGEDEGLMEVAEGSV